MMAGDYCEDYCFLPFFDDFILKKQRCELRRSHLREGAVKGFRVFVTNHRLSILFLYEEEKKKDFTFP